MDNLSLCKKNLVNNEHYINGKHKRAEPTVAAAQLAGPLEEVNSAIGIGSCLSKKVKNTVNVSLKLSCVHESPNFVISCLSETHTMQTALNNTQKA